VRYNLSALAAEAPSAPETLDFVLRPPVGADGKGVQPTMEPQVRMAHVTDVLRMVVLWRFGGVYLDADILPLRPLHALGAAYAANLGNYECTRALYPGWPGGDPIPMPPRLGGATVSCMCVCFLSFPTPRHPLVEGVLARGLEAAGYAAPVIDPRLREMDFGRWEGRGWSEVPRDQIDAWRDDIVRYVPPGGESLASLAERGNNFVKTLPAPGDAIVITHAGVIQTLTRTLRGLALSHFGSSKVDYGEVVVLTRGPVGWTLGER
jgi:hypothetical protein